MKIQESLKPSHSVEIAVHSTHESGKTVYLKSVLESGYEQGFIKILIPIFNGRSYNFRSGEKIDLVFKSGTGENSAVYKMPCEVIQRLVEKNLPLVLVKEIGQPEKLQRRQSFRLNIYQTYSFLRNDDYFELETKDLSSTGMLALTTIPLNKDEEFEINFDANIHLNAHPNYDPLKRFNIICRVIDCTFNEELRKYYLRIQFTNLSSVETKSILQYLYHKQTEMHHIQNDKNNPSHELTQEEIVQYIHEEGLKNQCRLIYITNTFLSLLALAFYILAKPSGAYGIEVYFRKFIPYAWKLPYLLSSIGVSGFIIALALYGLSLHNKKSALRRYGILLIVFALVMIGINFLSIVQNRSYLIN